MQVKKAKNKVFAYFKRIVFVPLLVQNIKKALIIYV